MSAIPILIGVHVHSHPEGLRATLENLQLHTPQTHRILLLPDGAEASVERALAALTDMPHSATQTPRGAAACFNRLVSWASARLYVFIESGSCAGPGWLGHLLRALDSAPEHGLAGPSTNLCWNEQAAFPQAGSDPHQIEETAAQAERLFAGRYALLSPLYSLADFCYAVEGRVVDAIGAADEGYGLGPCWEMDYNIRAARAGFQGLWACASYVHRLGSNPRRQELERELFEASKHRYQDKFCALRLRGERPDYAPHCRGEECEHFAPRQHIQIALSLDRVPTPHTPTEPRPAPGADSPLVSCIMPTRGRPQFVRQSIAYFLGQDYPAKELIVVYDEPGDLPAPLPRDERIRFLRLQPRQSIGAKRNQAIRQARGSVVAQWDDDDWYSTERLRRQVAPILTGEAEITALDDTLFFDLYAWRFWRCTADLYARLFVHGVHGGTLVYKRDVWERLGRYPDRSLREDADFLVQAVDRGARLRPLAGRTFYLYLRHSANSWAFETGTYQGQKGWEQVDEPACFAADRAFYQSLASAGVQQVRAPQPIRLSPSGPAGLISCIMPTADRPLFVERAIGYFLRQDYPEKELIVVDDGVETVAHLMPADPRIRYLRLPARLSVGAKRNLACEQARGPVIAHWDDDDWTAPGWLSRQAAAIGGGGADICGLDQVLFYAPAQRCAWLYAYPANREPWVHGGTLCYTRNFWREHPFPDIDVGEDVRFLWDAPRKRLVAHPDRALYVGVIHGRNTSPKTTSHTRWHALPVGQVEALLGADRSFYEECFGPSALDSRAWAI